ncbi:MAG: hypothetical protein PHW63_09700 [Alphaproteobacteria bacterium]|nr:hypothetical protein [Alphaproteobacteria bacterium]
MIYAILHPRVAKLDMTFQRKVSIDGGESDPFFVQVGSASEDGVELIDDVQVAKKVIHELTERGWRVVGNDLLPRFSTLTNEEATVLSGHFEIERLEN